MIGKAFGQVHFMPGSQESTADVWNVRIPGNPIGTTYGAYGACEECNGYGDAMDGAIIDQRPLAMLRKPHTMVGVTLPIWGWALGGILLYRVACR